MGSYNNIKSRNLDLNKNLVKMIKDIFDKIQCDKDRIYELSLILSEETINSVKVNSN